MKSKQAKNSGRPLYLDCFSGAAGNMILAALIDAGASVKAIRAATGALDIGLKLRVSKVQRGAIQARSISFRAPLRDGAQRRYKAVRSLLRSSPLSARVRDSSLAVFEKLAHAEGRVHGIDPDRVHFHEVGAADALGDIVGVCAALESLGVASLLASPLPQARGRVQTDHGVIPLPAPATLALLRGVPTYGVAGTQETVTPTGAALIATLADGFGDLPPLTPEAQGFGAGDERGSELPNVVRAILGAAQTTLGSDTVHVLETNLDDTPPEQLPFILEQLMADGALDASLAPLTMKKGRPGQLLRVIVRAPDRERLARRILLESSSLGVRMSAWPRLVLERSRIAVTTEFGRVYVKCAHALDGETSFAPEYEDCARLARSSEVPIKRVYAAAVAAARESQA